MKYITYSIRFEGKETHYIDSLSKLDSLNERIKLSNYKTLVNLRTYKTKKEAEADLIERKKWRLA